MSSNSKAGLVLLSSALKHADWDLIFLFDECRFNISHADQRETVFHRREERFADACIE